MPFYELILICKPGVAKNTAKALKSLVNIAKKTPVVLRNANILGDRVMARGIRSKDYGVYSVGRYV